MRYFDTNILVALVFSEPASDEAAALIGGLGEEELAISSWTVVEFSSVIAREVRMGALKPQAAAKGVADFEAMVEASFAVLLPTAEDFTQAGRFLRVYESGLRAGDALHLAIASNNGAQRIYSLDKTMLKAGEMLGLPMDRGIGAE